MSRVGKLPIDLPAGVTVTVSQDNIVQVKGPKGELSQQVDPSIKVEVKDNTLVLTRSSEEKKDRAMHGLFRSLVNNMVIGVSEGYTRKLELIGVGYRAESKGQLLEMNLGYSHDVILEIPEEIQVEAKTEKRSNPIITLNSSDKQLIGHVAAKIRSLRPPEPYKGKGIRFVGEEIRRKAGKAASV